MPVYVLEKLTKILLSFTEALCTVTPTQLVVLHGRVVTLDFGK